MVVDEECVTAGARNAKLVRAAASIMKRTRRLVSTRVPPKRQSKYKPFVFDIDSHYYVPRLHELTKQKPANHSVILFINSGIWDQQH